MSTLLKVYGILLLVCFVNSARILGIFHIPMYSHFISGDRIFKELAARGHEVTVISPYELKTPVKNLKHIVLTGFFEKMQDIKTNVFGHNDMVILSKMLWLDNMAYTFAHATLNHTNVQNLLNSNESFDIVIHENFADEAFTGFSAHYGVPSVIVNTQGALRWTNSRMGNYHNPAYVRDFYLQYPRDMNFLQRTFNTLVSIGHELFNQLYSLPNQDTLAQKYFINPPQLYNSIYNASLILVNSHVSITDPLPTMPNIIEIGGYHVAPPKPLPNNLKDYLDSAKEGVILFSMGSSITGNDIPDKTRNEILRVFSKLGQKVLWKWGDGELPGQPSNLKLATWLPQQDVLAHPNIKLFITHGGLFSTIEAIYHGVPVLGIPLFGDQELNVFTAELAGYGIGLRFRDLNETTFSSSINELLNNPKYRRSAQQRSRLMHDRPMKPLDTAIYWIEYVLRHNGAAHLKTAALSLRWYQLFLLDVVAAILLCIVVVLWVVSKLLKLLYGNGSKIIINISKKNN